LKAKSWIGVKDGKDGNTVGACSTMIKTNMKEIKTLYVPHKDKVVK